MIKHIHVVDCDSTQDILKEQLRPESHEEILVSCENQTSGRGRGEKKWIALPGTLCFSFNLSPHKEISFTALELSVLISRFFETKKSKLSLKWPNDLWNENFQKCGGILVQGSNGTFMAGVGLNLFSTSEEFGGIYQNEFVFNKKNWAREITEFIHHNRYEETNLLKRDWLKRCGHLNQLVTISEENHTVEGIFQGIGDHGEAEICIDTKISRIYNGTLVINS